MGAADFNMPPGSHGSQFATTQWSIVLAAGDALGDDSRAALAQLCEHYWYPLYAFVRHRVRDLHEAQDLTQAFFSQLFEKQALAAADRSRGRFRAFLLTSFKNFLSNERDKRQAVKRGGGLVKLSLDFDSGESRYQIEPAHTLTPEKLYERRWVLTLLDQVVEQLRNELTAAGKAHEFEQFKGALTGEATADDYQRAAQALDMTPEAAKQAAYRMRKRYRQLFRQEVARTVADESEVDDEINRLLETLGS
jgi:RNA polymerase sigma-70 factor (ECF subfamily)